MLLLINANDDKSGLVRKADCTKVVLHEVSEARKHQHWHGKQIVQAKLLSKMRSVCGVYAEIKRSRSGVGAEISRKLRLNSSAAPGNSA